MANSVFGHLDEEEILQQAERCLGCGKPTCKDNCPAATPIPQAIELYRTGKTLEAGRLLFQNNPLCLLCSYMCDVHTQCEGHCIRGRRKRIMPIPFWAMERQAAGAYLKALLGQEAVPSQGQSVIVLGPGAEGVAAALLLAQQGRCVQLRNPDGTPGVLLARQAAEGNVPQDVVFLYERLLAHWGVQVSAGTPSDEAGTATLDCRETGQASPGRPAELVTRAKQKVAQLLTES